MSIDVSSPGTQAVPRAADIRAALVLTGLTIAWMVIEGAASIWLGAASRSLLLEAFGIDSVIELISAGVILWWLISEMRASSGRDAPAQLERRAATAAGALLVVLSVYVVASAVLGLIRHVVPNASESAWGILIGVAAKIGMPLLAAAKLKVAARLGSRALRADAMEAITCGYLSVAMVVGLAASWLAGWWWVDSAASLAIVPLLIREAREAFTGECGCHGECAAEDAAPNKD
ncbi:MAG: cation transporter [Capsulimonadaceae bacterium]|nr:cation transporter [Capsulimonadaceae bacterium]